jgi:hypothetical protein
MNTTFARCALIALLLQIATGAVRARNVPASQPAGPAKGGAAAALEQKLLGAWKGPACGGDYTFNADGTFELENYTPGQNSLTGTWSIRWDALPPTLVLMCKTSDFRKKDPTRSEYEYLGKALELKILELDNDTFVFRSPRVKAETRYARPGK